MKATPLLSDQGIRLAWAGILFTRKPDPFLQA
jgi:hypothetical protein